MKISTSIISLAASQTDSTFSSKYENLRKWDKNSDVSTISYSENEKNIKKSVSKKDVSDISELSKNLNKLLDNTAGSSEQLDNDLDEFFGGETDDLRMQILKDMVEMFTGKKIKVLDSRALKKIAADAQALNFGTKSLKPLSLQSPLHEPNTSNSNLKGWGVDYTYKEIHQSKEGFVFSARGKVTNETGKEISFSAQFEMSREQYSEVTTTIKDGDALIDPLVIDFSGMGTTLSNVKSDFDLNADGILENIHLPSNGTGMLVYDKNGNGIVDNGTELFGPVSGDGFMELSQFDDDKNGWIDENDSVFSKLKIWEKDQDGTDRLSSLLEKDIGALFTGRVGTAFNLTNNHQVTGSVRETGLWMRESGGTGFIQEIDIVA